MKITGKSTNSNVLEVKGITTQAESEKKIKENLDAKSNLRILLDSCRLTKSSLNYYPSFIALLFRYFLWQTQLKSVVQKMGLILLSWTEMYLQQCVDAVLQQTNHNVTGRIEKSTSKLKKRHLKSSKGQQVDKPCHTAYRPC